MKDDKLGVDIHPNDALFPGISWAELIETVQCNKGENASSTDVLCAFREIINAQSGNAMYLLRKNMGEILTLIKK